MNTLDIVFMVLAGVGFIIATMLAWFVVCHLPILLKRDREAHAMTACFPSVRAVSMTHVDLMDRPCPPIDQIEVNPGERVLLAGQKDPKQNGIYLVPNMSQRAWQRVADLSHSRHIVGGAMLYVEEGAQYHDQTFVLKLPHSGRRKKGRHPDEVELLFEPLHKHLWGNVPKGQPIHMGAMGLPEILPRETVTRSETSSAIPPILHVFHGFWDSTMQEDHISEWQTMYDGWQLVKWDPAKCETLIRCCSKKWQDIYDRFKKIPVMRLDFMRCVVLHRHGGMAIDMDTRPLQNMVDQMEGWNYPRAILFGQGHISIHEAELIERTHYYSVVPGSERLSTHAMAFAAKHPLLRFYINHIEAHTRTKKLGSHKYDVTYCTGEDGLSHTYQEVCQDFNDIHIEPAEQWLSHDRNSSFMTS